MAEVVSRRPTPSITQYNHEVAQTLTAQAERARFVSKGLLVPAVEAPAGLDTQLLTQKVIANRTGEVALLSEDREDIHEHIGIPSLGTLTREEITVIADKVTAPIEAKIVETEVFRADISRRNQHDQQEAAVANAKGKDERDAFLTRQKENRIKQRDEEEKRRAASVQRHLERTQEATSPDSNPEIETAARILARLDAEFGIEKDPKDVKPQEPVEDADRESHINHQLRRLARLGSRTERFIYPPDVIDAPEMFVQKTMFNLRMSLMELGADPGIIDAAVQGKIPKHLLNPVQNHEFDAIEEGKSVESANPKFPPINPTDTR